MADDVKRIEVPDGPTILVLPAPEHLGPGVLMHMRMEQPGDGRQAEVYLPTASAASVAAALVDGPWHLVNRVAGKHHGPFSTEWDCVMARWFATDDWAQAVPMGKAAFDEWLSETSAP